jgi:hypothetical protein
VEIRTVKPRAGSKPDATNDWSGIDDAAPEPSVVGLLMLVFFLLVGGGVVIAAVAVAVLAGWL